MITEQVAVSELGTSGGNASPTAASTSASTPPTAAGTPAPATPSARAQKRAQASTQPAAASDPAPSATADGGGTAARTADGADAPSESFFPECFSVLLPAVLTAVPPIVNINGQPDNAERGDRFLPQLIPILAPLIPHVLPILIEQIQGANRARPGEETERAFDQLLSGILGGIVPQVVAALPALLQNHFGVSAGFAARAGRSPFRPAVVVDTEVAGRVLGPILHALATGIASALPQLLDVINGTNRPASRDMPVSWSDFLGSGRLWDNDVIIGQQTPLEDANAVEIGLELAPHLRWWKGIQVLDDNGGLVVEIGVENDDKVATASVDPRTIDQGGSLLFMKAKAFGAHTGMYRLPIASLNLRGQRTFFYWAAN